MNKPIVPYSSVVSSDMFDLYDVTRLGVVSNFVQSLILYDVLYLVTPDFRQLNHVNQLVGDRLLRRLLSEKRLVFLYEPTWGVGGLPQEIKDNIARHGLGHYEKPGSCIGLSVRGPSVYDIKDFKKTSLAECIFVSDEIMELALSNVGQVYTRDHLEQFLDAARNTVYEWSPEKSFDDPNWWAIPTEIIQQRAYLIHDISTARDFHAHIDLQGKSRWWHLRQWRESGEVETQLEKTSEKVIEEFASLQKLVGLPSVYDALLRKVVTPQDMIEATFDTTAISFRRWLADELRNQTGTSVLASKYCEDLTRLLIGAAYDKTAVLRWAIPNLLGLIPVFGTAISAAFGAGDMKIQRDKLRWKPMIFIEHHLRRLLRKTN